MARLTLLALFSALVGVHAQTVTITSAQTFQTMDGFGLSEAYGSAADLYSLAYNYPAAPFDYLFSEGYAQFSILRLQIADGANGILPTSPGSPDAEPTYVWDGDDNGQVWVATQAQLGFGVKTIYAEAFSAPSFMKSDSGTLCGVTDSTCASGDWRQAYANFLTQYVLFYAQENISISHIGFLNEPEVANATSSWMLSNAQQAADFLPILADTLAAANLSTKIACCDAAGWDDQVALTAGLLSANALALVDTVTSHAYTSPPSSPIPHLSPTQRVWISEFADVTVNDTTADDWYATGEADEGMSWANTIHDAVVRAGVSAYLYRVGVGLESPATGYQPLVATDFYAYQRLWAFTHWSRFVRPGAVRLGTSATASHAGTLKHSAFLNPDGSTIVQLLNNADADSNVTVVAGDFAVSATPGPVAYASVQVYAAEGYAMDSIATTFDAGTASVGLSVPAHGMVSLILSEAAQSGGSGSCLSPVWAQCGGQGYTGCQACLPGSTCVKENTYFSNCFPPGTTSF
ncbi:Glycoside hydrolase [Mycena chlorophos]|uniref:Glycoside hydrolase n=1 Tax=Mycena chlorophos TaxID=658473 RepID=A0A8H6WN12_MYCCL|nr:Glycoside hydrolase [Mycena chlorophos]